MPTSFDWNDLARYKLSKAIPPQYPSNIRTFYSPEDDLHGVLVALLSGVAQSLVINMYGYDDDELNKLVIACAKDPRIYVQMSLDKTQAAGAHEARLLKDVMGTPGTNLAIGQSTKHAISHLKVAIIDGLYVVCGSTNWSLSGEQDQDNQLTITNDPVVAAEFRAILDRNHAAMLAQGMPRVRTIQAGGRT